MGRIIEFNRDQAVEIAMHEFWQHGYSEVSIKSVSQKIGISRSSFYNTFGSIELLFAEVLDLYEYDAPIRKLRTAYSSEEEDKGNLETPVNSIRSMFQTLCKLRARDSEHRGCLIINCLGDLNHFNAQAQTDILGRIQVLRGEFHKTLRLAVNLGELPKHTDTHKLALSLQTLAVGINSMSKIIHAEEGLNAIANSTLDGIGINAAKHD